MHNISKIQDFYLILLTIAFLVFCIILWRLFKIKTLSLTGILLLGLLLATSTNILIFYNPLFFKVSSDLLEAKDIDWRQNDSLGYEIKRFKKAIAVNYLAVGSSQTEAIYSRYITEDPQFSFFAMSGMGPLDFILYKNMIKSLCNGTIILTLSDFDLGRKPSLLGAKLSPPQGLGLFKVISLLKHDSSITYSELQDFVFSNIFDAYRYQYVFKGFKDKLFSKINAFPGEDISSISDEEYLKKQLRGLKALDRTWFQINVLLLEEFIEWANKNELKVAIIEGGYYPDALSMNTALHTEASLKLEMLSEKFNNCSYIHSSQIYSFTKNDYRDRYHVKKDIGHIFTRVLLNNLKESQ